MTHPDKDELPCGHEVILWSSIFEDASAPFPRPDVFRSALEIRTLACGETVAAFVTSDYRLYAMEWGPGQPQNLEACSPRLIESLKTKKVLQVACGHKHIACVTDTHALYTMGDNSYMQLGVSPETYGQEQQRLNGRRDDTSQLRNLHQVRLGDNEAAHRVACGDYHTLVTTRSGQLYAMGDGRDGKLGTADTQPSLPVMVAIPGGRGVVGVAAGDRHSCAVTARGELYVWGSNARGQLAMDPAQCRSTHKPTLVSELQGYRTARVSAAEGTAALTEDGLLFLWGCHGWSTPQQVANAAITQVSVSKTLVCALTTDGRVWIRPISHENQPTDEISMAWDKQLVQVAAGGNRIMALAMSPADQDTSIGPTQLSQTHHSQQRQAADTMTTTSVLGGPPLSPHRHKTTVTVRTSSAASSTSPQAPLPMMASTALPTPSSAQLMNGTAHAAAAGGAAAAEGNPQQQRVLIHIRQEESETDPSGGDPHSTGTSPPQAHHDLYQRLRDALEAKDRAEEKASKYLRDYETIREELRNECHRWEHESQRFEESLTSASRTNDNLNQQLQELRDDRDDLRRQNDGKQKQIRELQSQLKRDDSDRKNMDMSVRRLSREAEELREAKAAWEAERGVLVKSRSKAQMDGDELKHKTQALEQDLTRQKQLVERQQADLKEERLTCQSLRDKLTEVEGDLVMANQQLSDLRKGCAELETAAQQASTTAEDLDHENKRLRDALDDAKREADEATEHLQHTKAECETLRQQHDRAARQQNRLQTDLETAQSSEKGLVEEAKRIKSSLETEKQRCSELMREKETLLGEVDAARTEIQAMEQSQERLQSELSELQAKQARDQQALQASFVKRLSELETLKQKEEGEHAAEKRRLSAAIESLEHERDQIKSQQKRLEDRVATYKDAADRAEQSIEQQRRKSLQMQNDLERAVVQKDNEIQAVKRGSRVHEQQVAELTKTLAERHATIQSLQDDLDKLKGEHSKVLIEAAEARRYSAERRKVTDVLQRYGLLAAAEDTSLDTRIEELADTLQQLERVVHEK
ncbi:unnamed protein product [Vitrella brassicaformis CCMP3155]|uniref:RCC1-like domain-containing protein n=1 Tax=Vitrella brassicaformis (strain CCMP3155) TaxID=1169540 RepID=A0A0G4GME6_VITBC|nr:unnamed protein product [Vitrella brassicaformis CCMP3155]|eukprot:CEM31372.1 unnamed protein product [Vitrella brassicaformis CCMP3155]